jgi:hypothetical protein
VKSKCDRAVYGVLLIVWIGKFSYLKDRCQTGRMMKYVYIKSTKLKNPDD